MKTLLEGESLPITSSPDESPEIASDIPASGMLPLYDEVTYDENNDTNNNLLDLVGKMVPDHSSDVYSDNNQVIIPSKRIYNKSDARIVDVATYTIINKVSVAVALNHKAKLFKPNETESSAFQRKIYRCKNDIMKSMKKVKSNTVVDTGKKISIHQVTPQDLKRTKGRKHVLTGLIEEQLLKQVKLQLYHGTGVPLVMLRLMVITMLEAVATNNNDNRKDDALKLLQRYGDSVKGAIKSNDPLCITFSNSWCTRWFRKHKLVMRVATSKPRNVMPDDFEAKRKIYLHILAILLTRCQIDETKLDCVVNIDENSTLIVPILRRIRAPQGLRKVVCQGIYIFILTHFLTFYFKITAPVLIRYRT